MNKKKYCEQLKNEVVIFAESVNINRLSRHFNHLLFLHSDNLTDDVNPSHNHFINDMRSLCVFLEAIRKLRKKIKKPPKD